MISGRQVPPFDMWPPKALKPQGRWNGKMWAASVGISILSHIKSQGKRCEIRHICEDCRSSFLDGIVEQCKDSFLDPLACRMLAKCKLCHELLQLALPRRQSCLVFGILQQGFDREKFELRGRCPRKCCIDWGRPSRIFRLDAEIFQSGESCMCWRQRGHKYMVVVECLFGGFLCSTLKIRSVAQKNISNMMEDKKQPIEIVNSQIVKQSETPGL